MSIAGSVPNKGVRADYSPDAMRPETTGKAPRPRKKPGLFRWSGLLALLFFVIVFIVGWMLFGNLVLRSAMAEAATKSLGVEVDVGSLDLSLTGLSLDLHKVEIAHPDNPMLNVIEIGHARVELEGRPLLRKKIVIRDVTVD